MSRENIAVHVIWTFHPACHRWDFEVFSLSSVWIIGALGLSPVL